MNWQLSSNLGGKPKCNIQFNLAPTNKMTSASPKAVDLAADTFRLLESGTTPLPIGVGKNGNFVDSMNFIT